MVSDGVSDVWGVGCMERVGRMGCRTYGVSDVWSVGHMGFWTYGVLDVWGVGCMGCRTYIFYLRPTPQLQVNYCIINKKI